MPGSPAPILPDGVTFFTTSYRHNGLFAGFASGVIIGTGFVLFGSLLCITIVGSIVGLPLILVGLIAPFIGPFLRFKEREGDCPYCGTRVTTNGTAIGFNCVACKERILVGQDTFRRKDARFP
jgi:hypothetical protein